MAHGQTQQMWPDMEHVVEHGTNGQKGHTWLWLEKRSMVIHDTYGLT